MVRLLPERTVDSATAIELIRFDPHALVLSPSQRAPLPFDHQLLGTGWAGAFFEAKAVEDGTPPTVPIDIPQLRSYLRVGLNPLFYLLPVAPTHLVNPHVTVCKTAGCCSIPGAPSPSKNLSNTPCLCCPRDTRSWTWLEAHYHVCPTPLRTQPWFSHWCWAIPVHALSLHAPVATALAGAKASVDLEATDKRLGAISGAVRLCHVLGPSKWWQHFSVGLDLAEVQGRLNDQRVDHLHLALRPTEELISQQ